jgi:PPOX class probable F420-dependent enzyme
MPAELSHFQSDFLKSHRLGVLATTRRSGAPQVSIIAYNYDGNDVVISTGDQSAKYKNASKRPEVSLIVTDGGKAVTVYGTAAIVRGAEAETLREQRLQPPRAATTPAPAQPARALPNRGERLIIRFTPEKVFSNRLEE